MDTVGAMVRRSPAMTSPTVRDIGAVNWIGLYRLTRREVRRFVTVWLQTVPSPVAATLMYLAIFVVVFDPVFYLVDGFRQGFVTFAETDVAAGLAVVVGLDVVRFWIRRRLFASGRGLKP